MAGPRKMITRRPMYKAGSTGRIVCPGRLSNREGRAAPIKIRTNEKRGRNSASRLHSMPITISVVKTADWPTRKPKEMSESSRARPARNTNGRLVSINKSICWVTFFCHCRIFLIVSIVCSCFLLIRAASLY